MAGWQVPEALMGLEVSCEKCAEWRICENHKTTALCPPVHTLCKTSTWDVWAMTQSAHKCWRHINHVSNHMPQQSFSNRLSLHKVREDTVLITNRAVEAWKLAALNQQNDHSS